MAGAAIQSERFSEGSGGHRGFSFNMPFSVNGFGTTYYGHADPHQDDSYVATKWLIFLFIPIIPLGSYRIKLLSGGVVRKDYHGYRVSLHFRQVVTTYGIALVALCGLYAFFQILDHFLVPHSR
ncbi:MAG: hypothetical protein WBS19_13570 [Candidatus Korobacteraceae bacterium]